MGFYDRDNFLFTIDNEGSFVPSAQHAKMAMKYFFF
jgi:hypothetical protein